MDSKVIYLTSVYYGIVFNSTDPAQHGLTYDIVYTTYLYNNSNSTYH